MENSTYKISEIASAFGINDIKNVKVCNTGHINGTFFADSPLGPIVIQQVNKGIFSDVPALMDNVIAVCKHIENKMLTEGASSEEISRGVLKYFPTADGNPDICLSDSVSVRFSAFRSGYYPLVY